MQYENTGFRQRSPQGYSFVEMCHEKRFRTPRSESRSHAVHTQPTGIRLDDGRPFRPGAQSDNETIIVGNVWLTDGQSGSGPSRGESGKVFA